ncbi:hypothetical protein BGZ98_008953, partial [Dissophora globulifera]
TERPQDGLEAVQARLRRGKSLHEQFANYFKERAHIEDLYAKNITKAFQKHFVTDAQALGTFAAPWEKLNAESLELATLHGQFSLKISNEIERPLRDFARSNAEWHNLTLAEANCNRIAKEFDEKQLKVTKYAKAAEKATGKKAEAADQKLREYNKQLESTRTAWRLEGPVVLQKFQDVDQQRLDHLKQMVSAFEAIQTEIVLQIAEMSGRTSAAVNEFESVMDIELFASELAVNLHALEPQHDAASVVSVSSHRSNGDTAIGSMDPRRVTNGNHKRVITEGSQMSNISYSTDRSVTQSKAASIDHTRTSDVQDQGRAGSMVLGSAVDVPTNHVDADGFTIPPPDQGPWSDAGANSGNFDDERSETSSFSQQGPKMQMEIRHDTVSESNDEARAAVERVTSTLKQTKTVNRRHPGRREVRSMYQTDDSPSPFNSYHSSPLSPPFVTDTPNPPSPGTRALFSTPGSGPNSFSPAGSRASTLGLPSIPNPTQLYASNNIIPPAPPLTLANGASVQRVATGPESMQSTTAVSAPTSPITATPANGGLGPGVGQKRVWVASVVEKVQIHTQAGDVSRMMVTGEVILNVEGTEVDPEQPKKALLRLDHVQTLERCVPNPAYLTTKDGGSDGSYWIDLETLSQAMQVNGLGHGQGVTVLKYQVKSSEDETRQTMMPLLIHPAWKCEPHQTSLLINYKANAHCKLSQPAVSSSSEEGSSAESAGSQLSELSFLVPVSGEVVNVQSRPTGVWNSELNKMLWDVDNVAMSSAAPEPHKLLARFELNAAGGPSQPSTTAVKFRVQGRLMSDLAVQLVREEDGQGSEAFGSVRTQVQCRYLATA